MKIAERLADFRLDRRELLMDLVHIGAAHGSLVSICG